MKELVSIQKAAAFLGVSPQTLRRWEREGKIPPHTRTAGGQRRYNLDILKTNVQGSAPQPKHAVQKQSVHFCSKYLAKEAQSTKQFVLDFGTHFYETKAFSKIVESISKGQIAFFCFEDFVASITPSGKILMGIAEANHIPCICNNKDIQENYAIDFAQHMERELKQLHTELFALKNKDATQTRQTIKDLLAML